MDLMDLKPKSDVVVATLTHPSTGEVLKNDSGTDMTITVFANHSKEYKSAMHKQQDKRIVAMQKGNELSISSEQLEKDVIILLSKITKDWDITYNKETPKISEATAKSLYEDVFWLKDQVESALSTSLVFTTA